MDNPQVNLNPVIDEVCKQYGFVIEWCEVLKYWVIRGKSRYHCEFFWTSDHTLEDFFDTLQRHFEEVGAQSMGYN